jgi:hypothetical protein
VYTAVLEIRPKLLKHNFATIKPRRNSQILNGNKKKAVLGESIKVVIMRNKETAIINLKANLDLLKRKATIGTIK